MFYCQKPSYATQCHTLIRVPIEVRFTSWGNVIHDPILSWPGYSCD